MASIRIKNFSMAKASPACEAAWAEHQAASDAMAEARKKLHSAFRETDEFKGLVILANTGGKSDPFTWDTEGAILSSGSYKNNLEIRVDERATYADPRTMNLLLTAKLLTDEEKRELLKSTGILPREKTT